MREVLEGQRNLFIKQAEVVDLEVEGLQGSGPRGQIGGGRLLRRVTGLRLRDGRVVLAGARW